MLCHFHSLLVVKSPLEIFNSHLPKLKDEVLLNADSFISDLCSAGIISSEADTTDGQSVTLHQKINHTLIAVRRRISESSEPEAVLVQFCAVLKNQNNDALYKLANEILSECKYHSYITQYNKYDFLYRSTYSKQAP